MNIGQIVREPSDVDRMIKAWAKVKDDHAGHRVCRGKRQDCVCVLPNGHRGECLWLPIAVG
jgi:hypothetical protein